MSGEPFGKGYCCVSDGRESLNRTMSSVEVMGYVMTYRSTSTCISDHIELLSAALKPTF
jgi:hypothetical protein